jgi:hypothetical protein
MLTFERVLSKSASFFISELWPAIFKCYTEKDETKIPSIIFTTKAPTIDPSLGVARQEELKDVVVKSSNM